MKSLENVEPVNNLIFHTYTDVSSISNPGENPTTEEMQTISSFLPNYNTLECFQKNLHSNITFRVDLLNSMKIESSKELDEIIFSLLLFSPNSCLLNENITLYFNDFLKYAQSVKPNIDNEIKFYKENCKISIANIIIGQYINKLYHEIEEIKKKINSNNLYSPFDSCERNDNSSIFNCKIPKRHRRRSNEIIKMFRCPFENCYKEYGFLNLDRKDH